MFRYLIELSNLPHLNSINCSWSSLNISKEIRNKYFTKDLPDVLIYKS